MAQLVIRTEDTRGDLTWISQQWQQPIQRMFWLHGVPTLSLRGGHRHQADCQMVLQCIVGSVSVHVQTPTQDCTYCLQAATEYLFLTGEDWRLMSNFSADAVLVVLASKPYQDTLYWEKAYRPVTEIVTEIGCSYDLG